MSCFCESRLRGEFGDSKIHNFCLTVVRDKNVVRFEITMDDPLFMRPGQTGGYLRCNVDCLTDLERPPGELVSYGASLVHGHDNKGLSIGGLIDLVDRADVLVLDRGGGLGLVDKPLFCLSVGDEARREKLEGNQPVELEIPSLVDHTHPTFADFLDNLVMGNGLADHRVLLPPPRFERDSTARRLRYLIILTAVAGTCLSAIVLAFTA
jgi:hypothetical protein